MSTTTTIPWEDLRGLPVRYSEWGGNTNVAGEDAEIVTNDHVAYLAEAAHSERNERLASADPEVYRRTHDPETVRELWSEMQELRSEMQSYREEKDLRTMHLDGVRAAFGSGVQVARLVDDERELIAFANAQYLRILQLVVDFDEIQAFDAERAMHVLRDGELVAVVMPRRKDADEWSVGRTVEGLGASES